MPGAGAGRQPYYRWLACPVSAAELVEAYRANALFDAHRDDPEFGHRFLLDEARAAGEPMAERTARRICRDNGWWSTFGGEPVKGWLRLPGTATEPLPAVVKYVGCGGGRGHVLENLLGGPPSTPISRWTGAGRARAGGAAPSSRSALISIAN
ncbi:acetylxylan esterase [Streptomyces camelliae]|uniref:acetylxylan esterase n=1 Tax=Streptomyces camelliae TaxID=3004093 RepID=UPI002FD87C01